MNQTSMEGDHLAKWALLAVVIGGICIGASPIMVRLSETGPVASAFWRVLLVLPFFAGALWQEQARRRKRDQSPPVISHKALVVGGALFSLDLAFWHWAVQTTTVANATLMSNLMTIVVALGAWKLFGEQLNRMFFIGLVLALAGAAQLAGASFSNNPEQLVGDGLGVITAFFYGAYMLQVRYLRREHSTMTIMFYSGFWTSAFLLPLAWIMGEVIIPQTLYGWGVLITLAFFSQLLGQSLITFGFKHLPSAFGAITLLLQPIVAGAIAWPLFNEPLSGVEFIGAGLILSGIVVARLATSRD